jgi:predicted aspartyl protease
MGVVKVKGEIGLRQDKLHEVESLVDTGSLYTFLLPDLASELGIDFTVTSRVVLADNRTVEVPVGVAYLRLGDREGVLL